MPQALASRRWLFGPVPDLLLGCGLLYWIAFVIFGFAGSSIRENQAVYLAPMLLLLLSSPHYGGTIVRAYESRSSRREYFYFTVVASVLVFVAFVYGLYSTAFGAGMLTLYLTWSPWHYSGQNFGLSMMFLRRRGVEVSDPARRWLHRSFVFSFLLTFLVQHQAAGAADSVFGYEAGDGIRFLPLGIPAGFARLAILGTSAAYLATIVATLLCFRHARLRDMLPTYALMLTQSLWFSLPLVAGHLRLITGIEPLDFPYRRDYFLWIALSHAIQYLWVTSYFARAEVGWRGILPYYGKVLAAGTAVWVLPVMLFSPNTFGPLSVDGGLQLLVAAAVNLHHFLLDGAIWKLRNAKIARVLLRSASADAESSAGRWGGWPWVRRAVWSAAAITVMIQAFVFWRYNLSFKNALQGGDLPHAAASLDGLATFGFDRAQARYLLGRELFEAGDLDGARPHLEESARLRPSVAAFEGLGNVHLRQKDLLGALQYFDRALELDDQPILHCRAASVLLDIQQTEAALQHVARALEIDPEHSQARMLQRRLRRNPDRGPTEGRPRRGPRRAGSMTDKEPQRCRNR